MGFLNKKVFDFSGTAIGLSLSDLEIRVAQMEKDGKKERIIGYGYSPISQGAMLDGDMLKKDLIVSSIKNAISKSEPGKLKSNKVICSIPETKAFLRIISIPKMAKSEAKEAIKWEIEGNIPLTIDQVYFDWQILDENISQEKNKMDVLVVAIAKNAVDQFLDVLEAAGLEVVGLEIESVAQARCLLGSDTAKGASMIIDIGKRRTAFSISSKGVPCFTSSVPVSGQAISNSIAKGLGISFEDAEKVKNSHGIGSELKNNDIFICAKPVLENLVSEVNRSMEFFLSDLKYASEINEIIICGSEANMKGLCPYLSKRLEKRVYLGNPWVNVNLGKGLPVIDRYKSAEYATAIGLALKGLDYENID